MHTALSISLSQYNMAPQPPVAMTPGTFPVRLPGHVRLDQDDIVGSPHDFDPCDGSCVVDFKNWQGAERFLKFAIPSCDTSTEWLDKAAKGKSDGAALLSMIKPPAKAKREQVAPNNTRAWDDDAAVCQIPFPTFASQAKYVVELSDLPRHLTSSKNLEAVLEQAEHMLGPIVKDLVDIVCLPAPYAGKVGKVEIILSSKQAADKCQTHFTTSKWFSGCTAKVTFRKQGISNHPEPATAESYGGASSSRLNKDAPAYVHSSFASQAVHSHWKYGEASDASTTVSSEDEWCLGELIGEL